MKTDMGHNGICMSAYEAFQYLDLDPIKKGKEGKKITTTAASELRAHKSPSHRVAANHSSPWLQYLARYPVQAAASEGPYGEESTPEPLEVGAAEKFEASYEIRYFYIFSSKGEALY